MPTTSLHACAMALLSMPCRNSQLPGPAVTPASTVVAAPAITISAALIEFVCLFGLLMLVIVLRTRLTIGRALRALDRSPNLWLLLHISISFLEVGRLQWRALSGLPVHPSVSDLVLGLVHCLSSYQVLLSRTRAGYKDLIPLGLRMQPFFFRIVATPLAFAIDSPALHHANIRLGFDSFLHARLFIFSFSKLSSVGFGPRFLHTSAAVLGGFVAVYDSGIKYGSCAYVVCSAASILLDSRTEQFMTSLRTTVATTHESVDDIPAAVVPVAKDIHTIVRTHLGCVIKPSKESKMISRMTTHTVAEVI